MKKVGLTGNIGSGKTTISHIFQILGIPIFNADNEAKSLMHKHTLMNQIIDCFGSNTYKKGQLDKKYLSQIVFSDRNKLNLLNRLVHPHVNTHFENWCKSQNAPYIIKEAAIIFESDTHKALDTIICVTCPKHVRIKRILERDNTLNSNDIEQRMNQQWDEKKLVDLSNYMIDNSGRNLLIPQVIELHNTLK